MLPVEKEGILFDTSTQSPPPSKDFINLCITTNNLQSLCLKCSVPTISKTSKRVIWRQWKINAHCLHPNFKVSPTEKRETHEDFIHDMDMHGEVRRVFGEHMLEYVLGLCSGNFDYMSRVSNPLQIYIISFLELEDIANLSQTSKHFYKLCNSEDLWEHFVERHCDTVTEEMKQYAEEVGWKHVFFTNKLQLQAQIRRHQQRAKFHSQSMYERIKKMELS